jgi:sodium-dependent phosphate cotransporter
MIVFFLQCQAATNMLYHMCSSIADQLTGGGSGEVDIIKVITEPFVDLIIQINSTVLEDWAADECDDCQLQKIYCPDLESDTRCDYLFNYFGWEDWIVGAILVVASLLLLCLALIFMVKILNSLLQGDFRNVILAKLDNYLCVNITLIFALGAIAVAVKKVLNPTFDSSIVQYLWGYVNIAIGAVLTFCVQSSSVFTSTLTPLVGIGLLEVETVYPLFLGSNIGWTFKHQCRICIINISSS